MQTNLTGMEPKTHIQHTSNPSLPSPNPTTQTAAKQTQKLALSEQFNSF